MVASLIDFPGASEVIRGGIVAYSDEMKHTVVGVSQRTLDQFTSISRECVEEMLILTQCKFASDCCIALSGNAGPTGSDDQPVGRVYIGVRVNERQAIHEMNYSEMTRNELRQAVVQDASRFMLELIG